jgi:uncharacterized membrane protein YccC
MHPETLSQFLGAAAWGVTLGAAVATWRRDFTTVWLLLTLAAGMQLVGNVVVGDPFDAALATALLVVFAWLWWRSGGGPRIRRRLHHWMKAFRGVRRTAPADSAA